MSTERMFEPVAYLQEPVSIFDYASEDRSMLHAFPVAVYLETPSFLIFATENDHISSRYSLFICPVKTCANATYNEIFLSETPSPPNVLRKKTVNGRSRRGKSSPGVREYSQSGTPIHYTRVVNIASSDLLSHEDPTFIFYKEPQG